jgi:hypothetical protein
MGWKDEEKIPAADITAGEWIRTHEEEDRGEPVQLLWRTVERVPNGEFRWSFNTSAGLRYFEDGEWVRRVTRTE